MWLCLVEVEGYDGRDVKKVKENVNYVMKFVKQKMGNENESIEMMVCSIRSSVHLFYRFR